LAYGRLLKIRDLDVWVSPRKETWCEFNSYSSGFNGFSRTVILKCGSLSSHSTTVIVPKNKKYLFYASIGIV